MEFRLVLVINFGKLVIKIPLDSGDEQLNTHRLRKTNIRQQISIHVCKDNFELTRYENDVFLVI